MHDTRIVMVRHGQADAEGVMSGWADLPLTELGRRQAAALAEAVSAEVVYSSPLRRARDTARFVERAPGALACDPDLREIGCGRVDGAPIAEVRRELPALWAIHEEQTWDEFRWPDGESYIELRRRAIAALDHIARRHPGRRVAVVTHAGVITQLVGHIEGVRPARWSAFRVGHASTTELDWCGGVGVVRTFDVRAHLAPALRT